MCENSLHLQSFIHTYIHSYTCIDNRASNVAVSSGTKDIAINNIREAVKDECRMKFAKKSANDLVVLPHSHHQSNYPLPSMEFTGTNNNSNFVRKPVVKVPKRGLAEAFQKQSSKTNQLQTWANTKG